MMLVGAMEMVTTMTMMTGNDGPWRWMVMVIMSMVMHDGHDADAKRW